MKKNKRLIVTLSACIFSLIAVIVTMLAITIGNNVPKGTSYNDGSIDYMSLQSEIDPSATNVTATNKIALSSIYTYTKGSGGSSDTVTLTGSSVSGYYTGFVLILYTAQDLYAFSYLANTYSAFLAYNYELVSNIDYQSVPDFLPIAWAGGSFSGTFNGNGFEISNLKLLEITTENSENYDDMEYYSMFSKNSGNVTKLGLVNTIMRVNGSNFTLSGVAPLVGSNTSTGNVTYCYVKDLRDAQNDDDAGIITSGGYQISGMVFENAGKFSDSYVAYNILCNYTITDYISFTEMLTVNTGTANSNLYFYNATIVGYEQTGTTATIQYDTTLVGKKDTRTVYGTYCDDISKLMKSGDSLLANWYDNASYSAATTRIKAAFDIETPILRGFECASIGTTVTQFKIKSIYDFLYMYELMNENPTFASNGCEYELNCDINLTNIPEKSYSYDSAFGATLISGTKDSKSVTIKDIFGEESNCYTIYNPTVKNSVTTEGIECFGFIPYLTGTIKNVNIYYPNAINNVSVSAAGNILALGLVTGLADGATIENVSVYGNLTLATSTTYYAGGIAGIMTNKSSVTDVTTGGALNGGTAASYSAVSKDEYFTGNGLGGIVGYMTSTGGNLVDATNAMSLTATTYTTPGTVSQLIGGVIGGGYTTKIDNIANKGSITVGTSAASGYGTAYVAGVIGKHIGMKEQVNNLYNQGTISVYANSTSSFVSGVENVELLSSVSGTLPASSLKNGSAKTVYYAKNVINAADINITGTTANKFSLSGVIYLNTNSTNVFETEATHIYNVGYYYAVSGNDYIKTKLNGDISVNMNNFYSYAPCVTSNASSASGQATLKYVYNFRNIAFSSNAAISANGKTLKYSGCILGKYMDLTDIRNEGNITYTLAGALTATSFITVGVFEEVTAGYTADKIYNAGAITLDTNYLVSSNIYFSGICYANKNGFNSTEIALFNPTSSTYNNKKTGSLNNAINNGDIKVTNTTGYGSIDYTSSSITSSNGAQTIGTSYTGISNAPTAYVVGNINIAGITYLNYSVITNTFNLGNAFAANYIVSTTTEYEVNASGISTLNISEYAYILNSANNGTIFAANLSGFFNSSVATSVSAAGITVRNDRTDTNASYAANNGHSKQLISFTINYGTVIAYNNRDNNTSADLVPHSKAAGILAMGLCNALNTVNYGTVYGNETASGFIGVVYFSNFASEVTSANKVTLANTINYGNVYLIDKGANYFKTAISRPRYSTLTAIYNGDSTVLKNYASEKIELEYETSTYSGSLFGIINFNSNNNANYVFLRYLISFLDYIPFVGAEAYTPSSVDVDVSNMYSAYRHQEDGIYVYDKYLKQTMQYAPLVTGTVKDGSKTYYGVFNENFSFRKAIEGKTTLNTTAYPTDAFLTDYFQFVGYTKINDNLLDKIGWRTIAYSTAANDFARDLESVYKFLTKFKTVSTTTYSNDITKALSTSSWIGYCENADEIVEKMFGTSEDNLLNLSVSDLEDVINYVFSDACGEASYITKALRTSIIEYLVNADSTVITSSGLVSFTDATTYSSVLASILSSDSASNDIKERISAQLNTYITNTSAANQYDLLVTYLEYLKTNGTSFFSSTSEESRYDLALELFSNIDDDNFYSALYYALSEDSVRTAVDNASSASLSVFSAFSNMDNSAKLSFYTTVIKYSYTNIDTFNNAMAKEVSLYSYLNANGYTISSFSSYFAKASTTASATDNTTISERVALYNDIRETEVFKTYLTSKNISFYDYATEYNSTYRSDQAPLAYTTAADSASTGFSGNLGYRYAVKVTPATYFYGEYLTNTGTTLSGRTLKTAIESTSSANKYSVFCSSDKAYMDMLVAEGIISTYITYYYEFGSAGTNNQFTNVTYFSGNYYGGKTDTALGSGYQYGWYMSDFSGCQLTDADDYYLTDDDGITFNIKGGVVSGFFHGASSHTSVVDDLTIDGTAAASGTYGDTGYNHPGYFIVWDANGNEHRLGKKNNTYQYGTQTYYHWASLILNHGMAFYHATYANGTATGLYRRKETKWFVNKTFAQRCYTTSYSKYTTNDFLLLDGVLTEYDGQYQSEYERAIINRLFENYFINDSNFNSMVEACYMEKLATKSVYSKDSSNNYTKLNNLVEFTTDGSLYTYNASTYRYTAVTSGTYNAGITYYTREKATFPYKYTVANIYTTDGSLYTYDGASYKAITSGSLSDATINIDYINNLITTSLNSSTTVSGTEPLKYLKYNASNTAYQYLYSLAASSTDRKSKLILAFALNKDVFYDVLNVLVQANGLTQEEVNEYLRNSDVVTAIKNNNSLLSSGKVYIAGIDGYYSNVTASSGSSVVYDSTKATDYKYGLLFDDVTFTVGATDEKVKVVAESKSGSTSLSLYNGTTLIETKTVTGAVTTYEFDISAISATSLKLVSNNDVLVYDIKSEYETSTNKQATLSYLGHSLSNTTTRTLTLLTLSDLETYLSANTEGTLVSIDDVYITATIRNRSTTTTKYVGIKTASLVLGYRTSKVGTGKSLETNDGLNTSALSSLGQDVYGIYGDNYTSFDTADVTNDKVTTGIINITYHITYTSVVATPVGREILPVSSGTYTTLESVYNNRIIQNGSTTGSVQYTGKTGIAGTYASAYLKKNVDYSAFAKDSLMYLLPLHASSDMETQILADSTLLKQIAVYSNAYTSKVITSVDNLAKYEYVLKDILVSSNVNFLTSILYNLNANSKLTDSFKQYLVAAYLTTDYSRIYEDSLLNDSTNVSSTEFYARLALCQSTVRYINADGTFNNDKFDEFIKYIGIDLSTSGYGIYALASSQGILNGQFIPDNFALDSMDSHYILGDTNEITVNANDLTAGTYTSDLTINSNVKVLATSTGSIAVDASNKTVNGTKFTQRIKLGGTGAIDQRSIQITMPGAGWITVYGCSASNEGGDRTLAIYDSSYTLLDDGFKNDGGLVGTYMYSVSSAGTYYIGCTNSAFNIYYIDIVYTTSGSFWTLVNYDLSSSDWRGGETAKTAKSGGVTDAFLNDMKQLKLSISTTIFELDLKATIDGETTIIYSSEDLIDLEEHIITYYVPNTSDFQNVSYKFYYKSVANGATIYSGSSTASSIANLSIISDGTGNATGYVFVTAEDTTVTALYKINIVAKSMAYNLSACSPASIESTGGQVNVTVTSSGDSKLPENLDLTPYITLVKDGVEYDSKYYTYAVTPVINATGGITISLIISSSLPTGTYSITVSLFGVEELTKHSDFTKNPSTECLIIDSEYDGVDVTWTSLAATTYIPFGRLYSYEELTNPSCDTFYLSYLKYSENATATITATKSEDDGIITYIVKYLITAESGATNEYTHTLIERSPFVSGEGFAYIYVDGSSDSSATKNTSTHVITVKFDRGSVPNYRIKYNMNNVYTDGSNIEYSYVTSESSISVDSSYSGLAIAVPDSVDAGKYTVNFVYYNKAEWKDGAEYEKTYTYPDIVINKNYSKDSLLSKLRFLENPLASTSTVMNPTNSIYASEDATNKGASEVLYKTLNDQSTSNRDIYVQSSSINYYNRDVDYSTATNFFAVGSVSNATLSDYAPSFGIESNAEIYQYTTAGKASQYGSTVNQTGTDTSLLTNTAATEMYLYVPFVKANGTKAKYLVKSVKGVWSSVYSTEGFNGTSSNIATISYSSAKTLTFSDTIKYYKKNTNNAYSRADVTSANFDDLKNNLYVATFTYESETYYVSSVAGLPTGNESLYMDYIGTPLDDHFWFVSYVVFSEDFINNASATSTSTYVQFYHIALIDASNTIYLDFTFDISEATGLDVESIYMYITDNVYDTKNGYTLDSSITAETFTTDGSLYTYDSATKTYTAVKSGSFSATTNYYRNYYSAYISAFALASGSYNVATVDATSFKTDGSLYTRSGSEGSYVYTAVTSGEYSASATYYKYAVSSYSINYDLQVIPNGYFYFYLDLPNGYVCTYEITSAGKENTNTNKYENGAYKAPGSIVPQKISVKIYIKKGTTTASWGITSADVYGRLATEE